MKDKDKTEKDLHNELKRLRKSMADFERAEVKHKRTEEMFRESEEQFRIVAQTAVEAIILADSKGNIIFWNKAAQSIFGYSEKEILGRPLTRLMPERYRNAHRKGLEHICLTGESKYIGKTLELYGRRKKGSEFPLELSVAAWGSKKGTFYTGIIRDITERKQMEEELERLAKTDKLTGAYNRTKFEEIIEREIERVKRYNKPLSMAMFDIDHFKKVNDTYGHSIGDYVLKTIADIVSETIRKVDYLIRWGGEEFMIISSETGLEQASALAERIRKVIEDYKFDNIGKITMSLGVTEFKKGDTGDTFIKRADDAVYKAKLEGRNRVAVSI